MRLTVPNPGNRCQPQGLGWTGGEWSGGALVTGAPRDLTGYDALTFMAKASQDIVLDVAGFANDNTGNSLYEAAWSNIPLTTEWQRFVIPIPDPSRLYRERGMFYLAEGPEGGRGSEVWFDQVQFEKVGTITDPRPVMASDTLKTFVGAVVKIPGTSTTFRVDGTDQRIDHFPGYFTFQSSDETVATSTPEGILLVGSGQATITATLGSVPVEGEVVLQASVAPTTAPPAPTVPAANVISLFSDTYVDIGVETWAAPWQGSTTQVEDLTIAGNTVKAYSSLNFAGVLFEQVITDDSMEYLHVDVWIPEGNLFKIKLVDWGSDGLPGGVIGRDSEAEICFTPSSVPPLANGSWVSLDIPLDDFLAAGLLERGHLAQMVLASVPNPLDPCPDGEEPPFTETAFIDNVYLYK